MANHNVSNDTSIDLDYCNGGMAPLVPFLEYWIQGIGILAIGVPGLVGNFISAAVLITRQDYDLIDPNFSPFIILKAD